MARKNRVPPKIVAPSDPHYHNRTARTMRGATYPSTLYVGSAPRCGRRKTEDQHPPPLHGHRCRKLKSENRELHRSCNARQIRGTFRFDSVTQSRGNGSLGRWVRIVAGVASAGRAPTDQCFVRGGDTVRLRRSSGRWWYELRALSFRRLSACLC